MSGNSPRPGANRPGAKKAAGSRTAPRGGSRSARPSGTRAAAGRPGAKKPKAPLTPKQRALRWGRNLMIVGLVGAIIGVGIVFVAYRATEIPSPNEDFKAQTTKIFYAGGKKQIGQFALQNRESIPLADIPQTMQDAVVAAEDRTFYTNKGIDPKGILRAAFSNARGGSTQGASTITQQYVKLLYLTQERTLQRKVKEALLSLKIQQQQSKAQILEGYLNTVYFGRGAYGVQAAANAFFGKPASELTVSQAAMLAAVLNSPTALSPDGGSDARQRLLGRYQYVLDGMVTEGTLDSAVADKVMDKLPTVIKRRATNAYGGQRGFMMELVRRELIELGFDEEQIEAGGLRVTTTFTTKAMKAAAAAIAEERPDGLSDKNLHVASASVDVKTGALLGFYAGQDYLQSQLNWAALGGPVGSTFKPFAVAAGLKDGFSLRDSFDGRSPLKIGSIEFNNQGDSGGRSYGRISLLQAVQDSVNTAFIDLTQAMENGPQKIVNMANAMGVPKDPTGNRSGLRPETGVSLGSATISPINMANAYATIADGGLRHDVFTVAKVARASDGEVLYRAPKRTKRVLSEDIAADVSFSMQQVIQRGTGRNARLFDRPAAGKTGTATNDKGDVVSSWFVGFTPQVATAVMYVRGKGNAPLNNYLPTFFGGQFPARTWQGVMSRMMDGIDAEKFPPPANVDGEAPASGYEPLPTRTPTPTPTPTPSATPTPTVNPTPTPTVNPTPTIRPTLPTTEPTPTGEPTTTCTRPPLGLGNNDPCASP